MPKGVVPPKITKYDRIILDFLNNSTANIAEMDAKDTNSMADTINHRIQIHKLEGLSVHCHNGKCIVQVADGYRPKLLERYKEVEATRERMLEETRERTRLRISQKKYEWNSRMAKRKEHIHGCVIDCVDRICYDFSDSDKAFLMKEIETKLMEVPMRGRAYHVQVAAMIYLLSKCPANSDSPLQFKEVYKRYSTVEGHEMVTSFYDAVRYAKANGIQTCRITPEILIMSKKDMLLRFADEHGFSQGEMREMISKAIDFTKQEKIKKELMGKNPFVISAAAIYKMQKKPATLTQEHIGYAFNVTAVSIRNTIKRFDEILYLQVPMPHPNQDS